MFKSAKKPHRPDLRGAITRRTGRDKKFHSIRESRKHKKNYEKRCLHKKAEKMWQHYGPRWSRRSNNHELWLNGPKLNLEEPFILSFHDSVATKLAVVVFAALILVMISVLITDADSKALLLEDSIVTFVFSIFILINGATVKFLHFIVRKPRFERAKQRFQKDHPFLACELWPEEAEKT